MVRFRWADGAMAISKEIRIGAGYLFEVKTTVTGPPFAVLVGPGLRNPTEKERASSYVMPASAVAATTDGLEVVAPGKAESQTWTLPARGFAGIEDNYFLEVMVPKTPATARLYSFSVPRPEGKPAVELAVGLDGQGTLDCARSSAPRTFRSWRATGSGSSARSTSAGSAILAQPLLWLLKKTYAWTSATTAWRSCS